MGKLKEFKIKYENKSHVFQAGSHVKGHVTVELKESMSVKAIKLCFKGKAKVRWSETRRAGNSTYTVTYSSSEGYFSQTATVYGKENGEQELHSGKHKFPFEFQLPDNIPSSFESPTGRVRYQVKCEIDKSWAFNDRTKKLFTVITDLDLNKEPGADKDVTSNKEKMLCCLCCANGPIKAQFHVDRRGYVPGEVIKLFAEISNCSTRKMTKSYVDLFMVTRFHAQSKSKTERKSLAKVERPSIAKKSDDSWTGEQLVIPPVPPSILRGCNIIDISYVLQLNVDPAGPGFDLEVPLDLIIGTIPLKNAVQGLPSTLPPAPGEEHMYPPVAGGSSDMNSSVRPIYSESITGPVDVGKGKNPEGEYGDSSFTPAYTYYNWGFTPGELPKE